MARKDSKTYRAYERALTKSELSVYVDHWPDNKTRLRIVEISIRGILSAIPSVTNSRNLWHKNPSHVGKLRALTELYYYACKRRQISPPRFDCPITVHVSLGKQNRRFDSHNCCKALGDWFEEVGIIDDDTNAEIFPLKIQEHKKLQALGQSESHTRITLFDREHIESATCEYFYRTRQMALSRERFYG